MWLLRRKSHKILACDQARWAYNGVVFDDTEEISVKRLVSLLQYPILSIVFLGVIIFLICFVLLYALPAEHWLVPNYHHFATWPDDWVGGSYQDGYIVFPGDRVNFNLGVTSLQCGIRTLSSLATTPGYILRVVGSKDHGVGAWTDTIFYDNEPPIFQRCGAIAVNLPADEALYGKSLPIHYSVRVSRPVLVSRDYYHWEPAGVEGTIVVNIGTRTQARTLEIYHALLLAVSSILTFVFIIWPGERILSALWS